MTNNYIKGFSVILIITLFSNCVSFDIPVKKLRPTYGKDGSKYMLIDGMNVHYRDEGNEMVTPILLLHDAGSSLHAWDAWAKEYSEFDFRVIRLDLPGFGLTGPHPNRDYTVETYRQFIANFLDGLDIEKCHVVGNGLGGRIAWEFAITFPKRYRKLVLMNALGYPFDDVDKEQYGKLERAKLEKRITKSMFSKATVQKILEEAYGEKTKVTEERIDRFYDLMLREGNRKAYVDRAKVEDFNRSNRIKNILNPTLIIWGDQDKITPIRHGSFFNRDIPNSTLQIYKNVGHYPMEEAPEESANDVRDFLKGKN